MPCFRIREPFDKTDEDALAQFLATWGGATGGNEVYKSFALSYPTNHTWQSWRDHYRRNGEKFDILIRRFKRLHNANANSSLPQADRHINHEQPRSSGTPVDPIILDNPEPKAQSQRKKNQGRQKRTSPPHPSEHEVNQSRPAKKSKSGPRMTIDLVHIDETATANSTGRDKGKQRGRHSSSQSRSGANSQHEESQSPRSTPTRDQQQMSSPHRNRRHTLPSSHRETHAEQETPSHAKSNGLAANGLSASRRSSNLSNRESVILNPDERSAFHQYMSRYPTGDIRLKDQLYDYYHQIAPAYSPEAYRSYYLAHRQQLDMYWSPEETTPAILDQSRRMQISPNSNSAGAPAASRRSRDDSNSNDCHADAPTRAIEMRTLGSALASSSTGRPATTIAAAGPANNRLQSDGPVESEDEGRADDEISLSLSSGSSDDGDLRDIFDRNIDDSQLKPCYLLHIEALRKLQEDFDIQWGEQETSTSAGIQTNGMRVGGTKVRSVALDEPLVEKRSTVPSDQFTREDEGSTSAVSNSIDSRVGPNEDRPTVRVLLVEKNLITSSDRPASSADPQPVCTSPVTHSTDQVAQQPVAPPLDWVSRTNTLCSSRRTISSTVRNIPSGAVSMAVAMELMNDFLSEFGHIYSKSDALALFKRCGDWTLMFEVGSLMAEEAAGVVKDEEEKKYMEAVMAMVWEEEEDKLLETPVERLTGRARRRYGVLEKRKGPQAIANRRVFLATLAG